MDYELKPLKFLLCSCFCLCWANTLQSYKYILPLSFIEKKKTEKVGVEYFLILTFRNENLLKSFSKIMNIFRNWREERQTVLFGNVAFVIEHDCEKHGLLLFCNKMAYKG